MNYLDDDDDDDLIAFGPQARQQQNGSRLRRMSDPGSGLAGLVHLNMFPGKAALVTRSRRQSDPGRGHAAFSLRSPTDKNTMPVANNNPDNAYGRYSNIYNLYASSASDSFVSLEQDTDNALGDTPTRRAASREARAGRRDTLRPGTQQSMNSGNASDGRQLSYAEMSSATQSFVSLDSGPAGTPTGSAVALSGDEPVAVTPGRARVRQGSPVWNPTPRNQQASGELPSPWDAQAQGALRSSPPRRPTRQASGRPDATATDPDVAYGSARYPGSGAPPPRRGMQDAANLGREASSNSNNPYLRDAREPTPQHEPSQLPEAGQQQDSGSAYPRRDGGEAAGRYQRDPRGTAPPRQDTTNPYLRDAPEAAASHQRNNRAAVAVNNPYQRRDTREAQPDPRDSPTQLSQSQRQPWEAPASNLASSNSSNLGQGSMPAQRDPRDAATQAQRHDPMDMATPVLAKPPSSLHSNYSPSQQTPAQSDLSDSRRPFKVSETPTVIPGRQQTQQQQHPTFRDEAVRPPNQEARPRLPSAASNRSGGPASTAPASSIVPPSQQSTTYPPPPRQQQQQEPRASTTARPSTATSNRTVAQSTAPGKSQPPSPTTPKVQEKPEKMSFRESLTAARPSLPRGESHMDTKYVNMLLAVDTIPLLYNILASFFTWILLAGFVLLPGTFTNLQQNSQLSAVGIKAVNVVRHVSLFVIGWVCTGIGAGGMGFLWYRWRGNYIWLVNRIFMPGFLNALAGVLSTLSSIFGAQGSTLSVASKPTIIATCAVTGICGSLTAFYMFVLIRSLKKQHDAEVGKQRAGKYGEGITDTSKRRMV